MPPVNCCQMMTKVGRRRRAQDVRLAAGGELQKLATTLPGPSAALPEQISVTGAGAFEVGSPEPEGDPVPTHAVTHYVHMALERSGMDFPTNDLVEVAQWGHFDKADPPWEQIGKISCDHIYSFD